MSEERRLGVSARPFIAAIVEYGRVMASLVYFNDGNRNDRREEGSDSLDEAIDSATLGVHHGLFEPYMVIDGERQVVGEELDALIAERRTKLGLDDKPSLDG